MAITSPAQLGYSGPVCCKVIARGGRWDLLCKLQSYRKISRCAIALHTTVFLSLSASPTFCPEFRAHVQAFRCPLIYLFLPSRWLSALRRVTMQRHWILNFDSSKLLLLFFYLYCYSEKQLIPITSKCFQGILSLKDHQKSLVWFKSIWKLFDFGDIAVKVSPHRCPMESSRCFGV